MKIQKKKIFEGGGGGVVRVGGPTRGWVGEVGVGRFCVGG